MTDLAPVTEEQLVAAFRAHEATIGTDNFAAYFTAIYRAMKALDRSMPFDLLEGLKRAYREAGDESTADAIAAGFSRNTGGIDVGYLIEVLGPGDQP